MNKEDVKRILAGHFNEITGRNKDIGKERMEICKRCPLLAHHEVWGAICNPNLYLNIETGKTLEYPQEGFQRGCGCRLNAKTKDIKSNCPLGKW